MSLKICCSIKKNCDIIEKRGNKYHIDTTLINRLMLEECGLQSTNIIEKRQVDILLWKAFYL